MLVNVLDFLLKIFIFFCLADLLITNPVVDFPFVFDVELKGGFHNSESELYL